MANIIGLSSHRLETIEGKPLLSLFSSIALKIDLTSDFENYFKLEQLSLPLD